MVPLFERKLMRRQNLTETLPVAIVLYCCTHTDSSGYHYEWIRALDTYDIHADMREASDSARTTRVADDEEKDASGAAKTCNSGDTNVAGDDAHKGIDILSQFLRDDGGHHTAMEEFLHRVQFGDSGEKKSNDESDSSSESSVENKEPDVMSDDDDQALQLNSQ